MVAVSFTDKFIASIAGNGERQDFYDIKVRGLVLRVNPSGSTKSWSVIYRVNGKQQRSTIGVYPATKLVDARDAAQTVLGSVAKGDNPAATKREIAAKALTLEGLIGEFLKRHASTIRTGDQTKWRMAKYVTPEIGKTLVHELHRKAVSALLDKMKSPKIVDGKTRKGTPEMANRVFDDLKALMSWSLANGYLELDPLAPLKRPAEKKPRERVLSVEEVKRIFEGLDAIKTTPAIKDMIGLLFLTACRTSEISELRKSEIDLEGGFINLPGERTKNGKAFKIPLVDEAKDILTEALARAGDNSSFVFPSPRGDQPIAGHAISVAVRRNTEALGAGWRPHDIRRTVATMCGDMGIMPHAIETILNHSGGSRGTVTTKHYNRSIYEREHRAALEAWAAKLEAIKAGKGNEPATEGAETAQ